MAGAAAALAGAAELVRVFSASPAAWFTLLGADRAELAAAGSGVTGDEVKETIGVAHVSFKLLNGTGSSQLEGRKQFYAEHPDFRMSYPSSWIAEAAHSSWV